MTIRERASLGQMAATGCDAVARLSLLAATTLLPWSFGGVDAFSQYLMFVFLVVAVGVCLIRGAIAGPAGGLIPAAAWPVFVILTIGLLQSLPVEEPWVSSLAPETARLRAEFLPTDESLPGLDETLSVAGPRPASLSVYAPATRKEVAILLAGLTVFIIAGQVFTRPRDVVWLAFALIANGAALAYFGIVQNLGGNGPIYGMIDVGAAKPFGPFVNRNGAGGFLVVCLAGMIPALAWAQGLMTSPTSRRGGGWAYDRLRVPREAMWLGLGILLISLIAGLLVAMSRGAWLGAVVGIGVTLVLVGRSWLRTSVAAGLLVGLGLAAALLAWLSLYEAVGNRMTTLSEWEQGLGGRGELWQDIVQKILPDFWLSGSGLGTFGLIQPRYQSMPMYVWYDQAENLFLQAFVEGGIVGGVMLIAMVILSLLSLRPLWKARHDPVATAIAGFGVFAIASQVVCATFDFSLRYPANHWALAIVVGACLGFARRGGPGAATGVPTSVVKRAVTVGFWSLLLAGLLVAWWEVAWSGGIDLALNRGDGPRDEFEMPAAEIDEGLEALETLVGHRPDDAEARLRMAGLHVIRYRQRAFAQLREELGAEPTDPELWALTALPALYGSAATFARTGEAASLAELRSEPVVREHLLPALENAWLARHSGPLLPGTHRLLAQLRCLVGDPLDNAADIARTVALMPQNPEVRYLAGRLHWDAGRKSAALDQWRRCLALGSVYDDPIFTAVAEELSPAEIIAELLPESVSALLRIVDRPELETWSDEERQALGEKLHATLIAAPTASAGEREYATGRADRLLGDLTSARAHLQRATEFEPLRVAWRLALAVTLRDLGEGRLALREAEACIRLAPNDGVAQTLWKSLMDNERNRTPRSNQEEL